jgi:hypothetical protein
LLKGEGDAQCPVMWLSSIRRTAFSLCAIMFLKMLKPDHKSELMYPLSEHISINSGALHLEDKFLPLCVEI